MGHQAKLLTLLHLLSLRTDMGTSTLLLVLLAAIYVAPSVYSLESKDALSALDKIMQRLDILKELEDSTFKIVEKKDEAVIPAAPAAEEAAAPAAEEAAAPAAEEKAAPAAEEAAAPAETELPEAEPEETEAPEAEPEETEAS